MPFHSYLSIMNTLSFDRHHLQEFFFFPKKPVLQLLKIHFISDNNKEWVTKVNNGTLQLKVSALDATYRELATEQVHLSLSSFIDSAHVQPTLELDQTIDLVKISENLKKCKQWKLDVYVNNITFKDNDSLTVLYKHV